jgi:outer membrane protein assembly factor BamE (lipoprotein component of BamABCDE complex)
MTTRLAISILLVGALFGCATPAQRLETPSDASQSRLTLGKVQQTLRKGMRQDEVISSLGSPNMVTKDRNGLETWIYDRLSSEISSSAASDRIGGFGGALGGGALLGLSGSTGTSAAQEIRTQKTLTVILKFKDQSLEDFSYNSTSF